MSALKKILDKGLGGLTPEVIEKSYCIMITDWEHGIDMFSDKIPREQIVRIVKEIASDYSVPFVMQR
jgi:hypothetical protein